ncbi:NUDIX domain-containing protein [Haloechinothrix alba]|uniref:NUDIX domain-containing protein n=1 Tax=Haloechinothrix alba TaxID=664784 RepID=A0A238VKK5_9PSEU|nr:NUDIX hydrolase [Haloechinothrix alba]SNR34895.1 NUDIX domain-containing protein [Haloechinothrix alba]
MSTLDIDDAVRRFRDRNAEGEPENDIPAGVAGMLPGKPANGSALITDDYGRILFITPASRSWWRLPGGVVGADEPPRGACRREVEAEIGLDVALGCLLVVDWMPEQGAWADSLQFVFDGGMFGHDEISRIEPGCGEVLSFQFVYLDEAVRRIKPSLYRRLREAMAARDKGMPRYTEFGRS